MRRLVRLVRLPIVVAVLAAFAAAPMLGGCAALPPATIAAVTAVATVAVDAGRTGLQVYQAVQAAKADVSAAAGIGAKIAAARQAYCARADLRAAAREDLAGMLTAGGVDAAVAETWAAGAKDAGAAFCANPTNLPEED